MPKKKQIIQRGEVSMKPNLPSYTIGEGVMVDDDLDRVFSRAAALLGDGIVIQNFRVTEEGVSVVAFLNGTPKKVFIPKE